MKNNVMRSLISAAFLVQASLIFAGDFDSSAPLPIMQSAALETRIAAKAYTGYSALRKKEHEIVAVLTSPAFEQLPHDIRETKRAENLVLIGVIVREENLQLQTYKTHYSNAKAIYEKMGPGQIAAARTHLEKIRTAMAADIGQRTETAVAMARAASLGGLSEREKREFRNYVKHLENKQAIDERFRGYGRVLEAAGESMESLISYMGEVESNIDLAIAETEVNKALNIVAKSGYFVKELWYQLSGVVPSSPEKMFGKGPDHSALLGDFGTEQPVSAEDEKTTDDYINKYSRR